MTKSDLLNRLISSRVLHTPVLISAFKKIDRLNFVPRDLANAAYVDYPLPIGRGQTISQPTTVAFMLELLKPRPGEKILDVGAGSGWTTALLSEIVGPQGQVWATEIVPELVKLSRKNLRHYHFIQTRILQAKNSLGLLKLAPFDKILVSASTDDLPQELLDQLKAGGRMVIPIDFSIFKIDKTKTGKIRQDQFSGFVFVPLVKR